MIQPTIHMWSLDFRERLYWAESFHLVFSLSCEFSNPSEPFHFVALVSPIKFDLGYDIYLMVAYIEYIWLKRNESESSLTKITQLLLKKVVQQRTGNFDLKFLCGSVFNQDEALVKY